MLTPLVPALLALVLAQPVPAGGDAARAPVQAPDADPCRELTALGGEDRCGEAPLCSPRERVKLACDLRDAMEARYVFFHAKPALLGGAEARAFDARRHLDACAAEERAIAAEDDPLRFYDRMRRCTAAFEDGHLILSVPSRLPLVSLGIGLRRGGDGGVHVANREPRLLRWLEANGLADASAVLAVGAEIVAVDGRPVSDALEELARHVPASSAGARRERAVDALTRRDFVYPERRTTTLTVLSGGARRDVELPWWIAPGADVHPLARAHVARVGLPTSALLDWRTDPKARWAAEGRTSDGLVRGDTILPEGEERRLVEYRAEGGLVAVRLGEATGGGDEPFCYAQLLTFHTETLSAGGERRPYTAVLEAFLRGCKERGRDLVLDLRQNEGGYISHSTELGALLTPHDETSPGGALVLRATAWNERVYDERSPTLGFGRSHAEKVRDSIRAARRASDEFTPAFLDAPLTAPEAVGGFDRRVVALVSPSCMSACDRLAGILREGGRAVLVGGATEGAGASQQEAKGLSAKWVGGGQRLAVAIPNAAMGVQRARPEPGGSASPERFFEDFAFENRPIEPHVEYATGLEDLTGHNRGWLERALAALRGPEVAIR